MIYIHKDDQYYWAEIVDLARDKTVGVTFRKKNREAVLQEALSIQAEYEKKNLATGDNK